MNRQVIGFQRCLMVVLMALVMVPGAITASAQGNSAAAHACQGEGYFTLVGVNGETFANAGQCVRFAAQGGAFADGTDVLEGTIVIPAGFSATLSNVQVSACNTLSFAYSLNGGVPTSLGGNVGCNNVMLGDVVIGPVIVDSVLVLYLTDHSCGNTVYDSDGNHARVIETAPVYEVDIADAANGCWLQSTDWPYAEDLSRAGNLSVTVTVYETSP